MERMAWHDRQKAYHALRAVLHALRDRLSVEKAASLSAQLPMLMRGFYFEGWHPSDKPLKERKKAEFLTHIRSAFAGDLSVDPEQVVQAAFSVIAKHVTAGEVDGIKCVLPEEIRSMWS